jgi:biotin operon repressor
MTQRLLFPAQFTPRTEPARFSADGETFEAEHDAERLGTQLVRVLALMRDGEWRTLRQIADAVGGSEAGVSARLRDLRKTRHGGYTVDRERRGDPTRGLWYYRVRIEEKA